MISSITKTTKTTILKVNEIQFIEILYKFKNNTNCTIRNTGHIGSFE